MLVLTRRPQESIRLGSCVRITVLGFKGNQVRLGIEAPQEVSVDREEGDRLVAAYKRMALRELVGE